MYLSVTYTRKTIFVFLFYIFLHAHSFKKQWMELLGKRQVSKGYMHSIQPSSVHSHCEHKCSRLPVQYQVAYAVLKAQNINNRDHSKMKIIPLRILTEGNILNKNTALLLLLSHFGCFITHYPLLQDRKKQKRKKKNGRSCVTYCELKWMLECSRIWTGLSFVSFELGKKWIVIIFYWNYTLGQMLRKYFFSNYFH